MTRPAYRVFFCALMAALGTALIIAGNLIPVLTYVLGLEDFREELWLNLAVYAMLIALMFLFDRVYAGASVYYERRKRRR